ncbi:TIGR04438 family Trp-rich protein [Massilia sp. W12]|uniref:TIGR04438 family Trp-rich protein n=1 Tax=Massilia sp. W12 TaxID=3126507 RepID=UPI0030CD897E
MFLIIITLALAGLKYFEVWRFAEMSWWWVIGAFALTFVWFEFIEKTLGLDKKKAHDDFEKIRAERIKKEFERNNKKR